MNVVASRANTRAIAPVVRSDATNMYVVKIAQAHRYNPTADERISAGTWGSKKATNAANESQKAPNDVNATAPNVFPVRNSHIPARSCANPPYARASPRTTGSPPVPTSWALNMLSTKV